MPADPPRDPRHGPEPADPPLTLANNPGAPHSFDITGPTPRTLEILDATFAFLKAHLTG